MEAVSDSTILFIFAAALTLAALAALVCLLILVARRRGIERIRAQIVELRRHPLVGSLPPEASPDLRLLGQSLNDLLQDLREQIEESRGRALDLKALTDGPPNLALIGLDGDWQVVHFNRGASALTQWPLEEVQGRHVEILFAPGEWERLLPKLARRSLIDTGFDARARLQRRDGESFATRLSVQKTTGLDGGSSGLLIMARDLTEDENLERRLKASEERYRRLVEEVRDGIMILRQGRIAYANPALSRILGIDRARLEGMAFKNLVDARDLLPLVEKLEAAERGDAPQGEATCRLAGPNGAMLEARLTWAGSIYENGRAVFTTVVDLTERARSQRVLMESEARLRATLHATGDGIVVFDYSPQGSRVSMANRAFCVLFGLAPESLVGMPQSEACDLMLGRAANPGLLRRFLEQARSSPEVWQEGVEIASPRRALVDLLAGSIRTTDGENLGLIITVRDVTARADGERRLKKSLDELSATRSELENSCREIGAARKELAERNQQLESINAELRSLDEMKSNLLANVSHELHTPLVSIKGYTEMIVRRKLGPLTSEQERGLSVALRNIDRLIEMIDNLLSFARLERGETKVTLEDTPLWQIIDEAIETVAERIRKKNLSVSTRYDTDDLVVRGDRLKLGQVFINLLTNALKFNREGGSIAVSARRGAGGFVDVDVKDTGIGIAPDDLGRIFERFYQTDSGLGRRYEGTGIGLSIVRDILRLHGCSIRVSSEPGKGSVFSFNLPLARSKRPTGVPRIVRRSRRAD
jgi:PAS domain S-box-containing protein